MPSNAFFDSVYAGRDDYYGTGVRPEFMAFLSSLSPGDRLLDIGAGQGRHALIAARQGLSVHAIDYSEVAMRQLQATADAEHIPVTAEFVDGTRFEPAPDSYDAVIMISLLSHLDRADVPPLVDMAFKALKRGGQVFIEAFTVDDPGFYNDPAASETVGALRSYFEHGELRQLFGTFDITGYSEFVEDDYAHGPYHQHGVALLVGKKEQAA